MTTGEMLGICTMCGLPQCTDQPLGLEVRIICSSCRANQPNNIHIGGGPVPDPSTRTLHQRVIELDAALTGTRGPDQQRIAEVGLEWLLLLLAKNRDYGGSAWQVPALAPHMSVGDAILCRMSDKLARMQRLLAGNTAAVEESIEDTIRDFGAYCLLWLARPSAQVNAVNETDIPY